MMGKPPRAGLVKTRLGRDLGVAQATSFYRHAVGRTLHRLGRDPRWETWLAVNAAPTDHYLSWPPFVNRMPQGQGDLGDRMGFVFDCFMGEPVVIIGTDAPQIEPKDIATAFEALQSKDAVFGPAEDGGYWLIGLAQRRRAPDLFTDVRWSTEHTLDDTVRTLPASFHLHHLHYIRDVDSGADHRALQSSWGPLRYGPWVPSA